MNTPAAPVSRYASPADLADVIALFPLTGVLLLPRIQLPLNIFEPRYLAMTDHAMSTSRLIGMIQPARGERETGRPRLERTGTVGRITSYGESDDGRYVIALTGVCRFTVLEELDTPHAFRMARVSYDAFAGDFAVGEGEGEVDRGRLLSMFQTYLEARKLQADWDGVSQLSTEQLVNTLAMMSPYGPGEKQAMLEVPGLGARAELLIALTEMELQRLAGDAAPPLQ